jgi:hypothetical protein
MQQWSELPSIRITMQGRMIQAYIASVPSGGNLDDGQVTGASFVAE